MENHGTFNRGRRRFISTLIPACALTCFGQAGASGMMPPLMTACALPEKHKFDNEVEKKVTRRQELRARYGDYIRLAKALEKEWGEDKLIDFLKKMTREHMLVVGKQHAKGAGDDSFDAYVNTFRGPQYEDSLTMKIVEDTQGVFELKVTECIWASTFREAKAGSIGHAHVCFGDYAWAEGFNPRIKLVRDHTLMQGHAYCNHRYLWQD